MKTRGKACCICLNEYHYTLYYYDQAGNLVKTVPPAGVQVNRSDSWLTQVKAARASGQTLVPGHTLATQYRYNTLNQVVSQQSPDGGASHFWYDRLGRLVVSQNAKQAESGAYSYTLYDELGRITEVGEVSSTAAITDAISRNASALQGWLSAAASTKTQITRTVYDQAYDPLSPVLQARNLRNRVAWTALYNTAADLTSGNHASASFYSYDIHGNVDTLIQDYKGGTLATVNNRFKKLVYRFDLISGKVNHVAYQPGQADAFYHRYSYDAENRLTNVETSRDSVYWENEAFYQYYKHGPLARTVLGQQQVQGVDYAYTLQGWLKGVNSTVMTPEKDMGGDGKTGSVVARDAFGFALHYYGDSRDYSPIATGVTPFISAQQPGLSGFNPLFNGNIAGMSVAVPQLGSPLLNTYTYDVLNRLRVHEVSGQVNTANQSWTATGSMQDYKEVLDYDGNGNITRNLRMGNPAGGGALYMDSLTYTYKAGTNQLDHVRDSVGAGNYTVDIDNQGAGNYSYDAIGNLVGDNAEGISSIEWTVYGKIKKILKTDGTVIRYTYDAAGNRISKDVNGKQTWYVRDAQGNVMGVYSYGDIALNSGQLTLSEQHLYGSSRLGMVTPNLNMQASAVPVTTNLPGLGTGVSVIFTRGSKFFELSNHLGNVLATVSDKKIGVDLDGNGTVDYYRPQVVSAQDYYAFGMLLPGRTFSAGSGYRYGFNGQESSPEVNNNSFTAEFWQYDARLGRRWNVDPRPSVGLSPYHCFAGNPLFFVDPHGDTTINGQKYEGVTPSAATYMPEVIIKTATKRLHLGSQDQQASMPYSELNSILLDRTTSSLEKLKKMKETEFKYPIFTSEGYKYRLNDTHLSNIRSGKGINGKIFRRQLLQGVSETVELGFTFIEFVNIGMSQRGGSLEVPFIGGLTQMMIDDQVADADQFLFEQGVKRGYDGILTFMRSSAGARNNITGVYTSKAVLMNILEQGGLSLTRQAGQYSYNSTSSDGKKYEYFLFFNWKDRGDVIKNFGVVSTQ